MKTLGILALSIGIFTASCTAVTPGTPAQQLYGQLQSAVDSHRFYFGHHDDPAYGRDWRYVEGNSDVKTLAGAYPGMMSWDMGMIEVDSANNLDGVPFAFMASEIVKQHERGGVSTISWHPLNPVTGGNSWDTSASPLQLMQDNPAVGDTLAVWVDRVADFIGSLRDQNGKRVPVIFRPWHENSGSWFWWGSAYRDDQQYTDLWKLTRERFDAKGIDNVLWAYSPDKDIDREQYLATYPGDEYVDILACDIYHFDGENGVADFRRRVDSQFPYIVEEAARRGKLAAFAETGLEGITMPEWYTEVLLPVMKRYPLAYVCVWRNANINENPKHYYVPYKGHAAEADFVKFASDPAVILVK
ncbi:MAG: glycoside hydrolase family 26 protein [Muribaculaceae bacterium]|nr:glycoside hydrolase family 26 protein [Muribaculaceae bacterium]